MNKEFISKVEDIIRQMDCDDRGKPYVYNHPSMVIWTDKWRGWVAQLREAVELAKKDENNE